MKIKVLGNSITIISSLTRKEIKDLRSFDAELILRDEKNNELFKIKESNQGEFSPYGISYDATEDQTGNACVTICVGSTVEDVNKFISEHTKPFTLLQELEDMAIQKLHKIYETQASLLNSVEYVPVAEACNCDDTEEAVNND